MEWIQLMIWTGVLAVSLFALIRGADVFMVGAKQVGASLGMSKFAIGVLIVGFGTSLPELASSLAGVLNGASEIVIANVVGSNITNILLIVGVLATVGGHVAIKQDLIKTELPIFSIAVIHFFMMVLDGVIDRLEAMLLLGTFGAYLWYLYADASSEAGVELESQGRRPALEAKSLAFILVGITAVIIGAQYTVDMAVNIATALAVPIGLVSIAAIAIGTSLPELFVSLQAIKDKEADLAIGNIFGSSTFNILIVIGIPALITPLFADAVVMELGLGIMLAASGILFIAGLARQIRQWEGVMLLLFFGFFLIKLMDFI